MQGLDESSGANRCEMSGADRAGRRLMSCTGLSARVVLRHSGPPNPRSIASAPTRDTDCPFAWARR